MSTDLTSETQFDAPQGTFTLRRHGHPSERLRAWDAADAYILREISSALPPPDSGGTLIVNDGFGALSLALHAHAPISLIESAHGQRALRANLLLNPHCGLSPNIVSSLSLDVAALPVMSRILIKIPKSHSQLMAQIERIRPLINPQTEILGAAMAKRIQASTVHILNTYLGPAKCSLAWKKARLIRIKPQQNPAPLPNSWQTIALSSETTGLAKNLTLQSVGGTFSHGKLDLGTRLLLMHMPELSGPILDYGCGNGVLGIVAALKGRVSESTYVDDAAAAIAATQVNIATHLKDHHTHIHHADSLEAIPNASQAHVLNNPPFHDAAARTPYLALNMFRDAHRVLKTGGCLWVVGNRHLAYHAKLRSLFGNCRQVGSHKKFVVLCATKAS